MKDITGQKFGRLTAIKPEYKDTTRAWHWLFKCDCGKEKIIDGSNVRRGSVKSCGCLNIELTTSRLIKLSKKMNRVWKNAKTHGHSSRDGVSKTYKTWTSMICRCNYLNSTSYKNYGNKGIKVSKRWRNFENFLSDMGERPDNMSLDRKDNRKGYYKENCKWATNFEQARNKRNNHWITYKGENLILSDWATKLNINKNTLNSRINLRKWSIERALTTPVLKELDNIPSVC